VLGKGAAWSFTVEFWEDKKTRDREVHLSVLSGRKKRKEGGDYDTGEMFGWRQSTGIQAEVEKVLSLVLGRNKKKKRRTLKVVGGLPHAETRGKSRKKRAAWSSGEFLRVEKKRG